MNKSHINMLDFLRIRKNRLPWWIEIRTAVPRCIYYFGPFESRHEAKSYQYDYINDLLWEGAQGIEARIGRRQPKELTIVMEE